MSRLPAFLTDHGRCSCGKVKWATRSDAKRFAKKAHRHEHVRAYQCGDFWHLGHVSQRLGSLDDQPACPCPDPEVFLDAACPVHGETAPTSPDKSAAR